MEIELPHVTCKRCGYEWVPRREIVYLCANPKCRTPKWNEDAKSKAVKVKRSKVA
jgi:uncharacterized OB-fold protein